MFIQEHFDGLKIPPGWELVTWGEDGGLWMSRKRGLTVCASISKELDGNHWLHLSISHQKRIPTYDELTYLKRHWAGPDKKCIMVLPPSDEHVNIHKFCLQLFCCLDADPLPDFTWGLPTI